jgi:hypothetical protein
MAASLHRSLHPTQLVGSHPRVAMIHLGSGSPNQGSLVLGSVRAGQVAVARFVFSSRLL